MLYLQSGVIWIFIKLQRTEYIEVKMSKQPDIKKPWLKPGVFVLNIKKDTFGGSQVGAEGQSKGTANVPKDPTPR